MEEVRGAPPHAAPLIRISLCVVTACNPSTRTPAALQGGGPPRVMQTWCDAPLRGDLDAPRPSMAPALQDGARASGPVVPANHGQAPSQSDCPSGLVGGEY